MTNSSRNEYRVETVARGDITWVWATNSLDAIKRSGATPDDTYRVDLCWQHKGLDRYTPVWR